MVSYYRRVSAFKVALELSIEVLGSEIEGATEVDLLFDFLEGVVEPHRSFVFSHPLFCTALAAVERNSSALFITEKFRVAIGRKLVYIVGLLKCTIKYIVALNVQTKTPENMTIKPYKSYEQATKFARIQIS